MLGQEQESVVPPVQVPILPWWVPPPPPENDTFDWIRLKSGEWLKGEINSLTRHTLEFDSDELDELSLDWDDVSEVRTNRPFAILRSDRTQVTGVITVIDDRIIVATDTGEYHTDRSNLVRMVPGSLRERDHWSGKVSLGATSRSGNTNQLDLTASAFLKRRTASSRFDLSFFGAYSEVERKETSNNERFEGKHDIFVGSRLFITTLALELYRDPFQNLDLRAVPYTGVGYTVFDENKLEWDVNAGLGYRFNRFASVEAGEDDTEGTGTVVLGTSLDSDVTEKLELIFDYSAQVGMRDLDDTNQNASVALSFDLFRELDADFTFLWTRVGEPERDSAGVIPEKNDYRFTFGLGWEF
jgi:putative salt-induced outer membrane protein YdiY